MQSEHKKKNEDFRDMARARVERAFPAQIAAWSAGVVHPLPSRHLSTCDLEYV
jgi:hypothetical protein